MTNWPYQICSLSTIMREYVGLHSVASLPFKDLILSAAEKSNQSNLGDRAWNVPQTLTDYLQSNLNDSQLDAVQVSLFCKVIISGNVCG